MALISPLAAELRSQFSVLKTCFSIIFNLPVIFVQYALDLQGVGWNGTGGAGGREEGGSRGGGDQTKGGSTSSSDQGI